MDFSCIVFGCLFIADGLLFALGKIHKHLSFWKTMRSDEKKKWKIEALCRNIGEIIMLNGLLFLIKGIWSGFSKNWFMVSMLAWFIMAGFDVWLISKSDRFRNE